MSKIPYASLEKGAFLVASPDMTQGVFSRSVILLCEHSFAGSFGLILNKLLSFDVSDDVFSQNKVTNGSVRFCMGGPIQANQMMLLHSSEDKSAQALEICRGVYLGGDVPFLQGSMSDPNGPSLFLCFGYSGWQNGQLEREFLDGNWLLSPASSEYVFQSDPGELWSMILRDLGGKYASFSTVPEDIFLN